MTNVRAFLAPLCVVSVIGCSQSPISESYEVFQPPARADGSHFDFSAERALRGARHWQVLAKETIDAVTACMDDLSFFNEETEKWVRLCRQDSKGLKGRPVHVELMDSGTDFGRVFHDFLTTQLVEGGQTVSSDPKGALVVRSRLRFVPRDGVVPLNSTPGTYALIGTGVWALKDSGSLLRLLGLGALTDAYVAANSGGGAQIIVTTSLMDGSRFIMRRSNAFFIENSDFLHYASTAPTADMAPPPKLSDEPPAVRTIKVVAE